MIRAATLFSGIGAPEAAMPGWHWLWHAEIEPFPAAVLAARHPRSVNLGDVTAHDFAHRALAIGRPDVLVFGSPCQSFSVAGRRLGLDDPRGNLALVALAVVRSVRPPWFLFENVPGLLSSEGGRDFGAFLGAVAECGYLGCWRVLDAQHFGLAQRRQRVFFVGCPGDWRTAAEVLFEPESLRGHPAPGREAGQGVAGCVDAGARNRGLGQQAAAENLIAIPLKEPRSKGDAGSLRNSVHGGHGDPMFTLQAGAQHGVVAARGPIEVSSTVTSKWAKGSGGPTGAECGNLTIARPLLTAQRTDGESDTFIALGSSVRRLTPTECERLQGFPDGHTAIAHRGKPAADGPRFRALGNSMAVPVVRWLLTRIGAQLAATAAGEDAA